MIVQRWIPLLVCKILICCWYVVCTEVEKTQHPDLSDVTFDCSAMNDGIHVDGCSNVFWFCNSGTASFSKCPNDLYFNIEKLKCDRRELVPACIRHDQNKIKFLQNWKKQVTHYMLEYNQTEGICEKVNDGEYAISKCSEKFLLCVDGRSLIVECHSGQLYSPELRQCTDARNLPFCQDFTSLETSTVAENSFSCSSLPDGTYKFGDCEQSFAICLNGIQGNASCGPGLVYNEQTKHCDYEFNVEKCPKFKKGNAHKIIGPHQKQNVCQGLENGMYAIAKCYGKYLFCIDGRGLVVICSAGQLFSPEHQQCIDFEKLPACTNFVNYEKGTIASPAACFTLPDGVYELGDCERNFLICYNGEGSIASCDSGLVYNGQNGLCEYKSKVEKCSESRKSKQRRNQFSLPSKETDCRCQGQKDGLYAVGCTEKFYSCSNGIATGLECPHDLVFNVDTGSCDFAKNVAACGGQWPMTGSAGDDGDDNDDEGERSASDLVSGCSILDDGTYSLSPCGSGYYHCFRGATSFAKCAADLVFNPSSNKCDRRENVPSCSQFDKTTTTTTTTNTPVKDETSKCANLNDGFYGDGCNASYYGCSNGKIFHMNCPWDLVFNDQTGICDKPNNVKACSGTSNDELHAALSKNDPRKMPSCTTLPNGPYQLGPCLADYISCYDGIIELLSCPDSMVFDADNIRCTKRSNVPACGQVDNQLTKNELDVYCAGRPDGILSYNCSRNFFICAKDKTYWFTCPDELVYDKKFHRCGKSSAVQSCPQPVISTTPASTSLFVKDDDKFCHIRPNGNYAAGPCSPIFFTCLDTRKVLMLCPQELVFDASTNKCDLPINVADCRYDSTTSENVSPDEPDVLEIFVSSTIKPLCAGRKDDIYELNSCSTTYLQCYNQKETLKQCPEGTVFDGTMVACVPKAVCHPKKTSLQEKSKSSGNNASYCFKLADGNYSTGCVPDFITCTDGIEMRNRCPNSTVFSNILRRCIPYAQCEFLMYRLLSSFHPSHRVDNYAEWMKYGSTMNTPLVYGSGLTQSKSAGLPNKPSETTESKIKEEPDENRFCVPELSGNRIDSIRCDKLDDGIYSLECSDKVVVCNAGRRNVYGCSRGQLFIPSLKGCVETQSCTTSNYCGTGFVDVFYVGKVTSTEPTSQTPPTSSFSCANKIDGNYGMQCSATFYKCYQQVPFLMKCPKGRVFDQRSGRCIPSHRCPVLLTNLNIEKVKCVENERFSTGTCKEFYYKCLNGKFSLFECPYGQTFDAITNLCGFYPKCNPLHSNQFICNPGEVVPVGRCTNMYLECNSQRTFEMKYCQKSRYFDSHFRICRFWYEIPACLKSSSIEEAKIHPAPSSYHINDIFKRPVQLFNSYSPWHNINQYKSMVPDTQWIRTHPYQSGMLIPPRNVFIPQTTDGPHISSCVFGNLPCQRMIRDTFRVVPPLVRNIPRMPTYGSIDQFQFPGHPFVYPFITPPPLSPYQTTMPSSSNPDDSTDKKGTIDSIEGSGEGENTSITENSRIKRDISFETWHPKMGVEFGTELGKKLKPNVPNSEKESEDDYFESKTDLCPSRAHPVNVTLGVCRPSYIFCNLKENTVYILDCNDGELFDSKLKKCIPAMDCMLRALYHENNGNERTPCDLLPDGTYSIPSCSQYFLSCVANKAILRTCTNGRYYDGQKQKCDKKENIAICNQQSRGNFESLISKIKVSAVTSQKFTCSFNSTVSFGCSQSFVICASGIAYVFRCNGELVFDQVTGSCNSMEDTSACFEKDSSRRILSITSSSNVSSPFLGLDDLPYTFANLTEVSFDASSFDCKNEPDGLYAPKCSPVFFVCSAGNIIGFMCNNELVFNLGIGSCDQKDHVLSCEGTTDHTTNYPLTTPFPLAEKIPSESDLFTVGPNSYETTLSERWKCEEGFSGVISEGCSSMFVLCINGEDHQFTCDQDLVYDASTNRCDQMENVAACNDDYKVVTQFRKRAYAVQSANQTIESYCNVTRGETVSYGRCRESYIACTHDGIPRKLYCVSGSLFDEDVGRCVPSEVCGVVGDAIAESESLAKRKCIDVKDGISMRIGPCSNEYYVCIKGIPIRRRCFRGQETFSGIARACVARSLNPECLQKSFVLSDKIKEGNDSNNFCTNRPDGIYRHPTDCTRILQCFGEELFEQLPCNDGLVFNEISGGCDYRSNVPECTDTSEIAKQSNDSSSTSLNCEEKSHGVLIADEKDCSVFYRCLWGKLEKFTCPEHTVFNPDLSVCDSPSAVPNCNVTT